MGIAPSGADPVAGGGVSAASGGAAAASSGGAAMLWICALLMVCWLWVGLRRQARSPGSLALALALERPG